MNNCKLSHIEYILGLNQGTSEQVIEKLKIVLSKCHLAVSLDTHLPDLAELIKNNFECYGFTKVPIGYNGGYQYHIIIRNTFSKSCNLNHMRPLEKEVEEVKKIEEFKSKIKGGLRKTTKQDLVVFMRSRKRKSDIVDELLQIVEKNIEIY
jgi:hypothetical protein